MKPVNTIINSQNKLTKKQNEITVSVSIQVENPEGKTSAFRLSSRNNEKTLKTNKYFNYDGNESDEDRMAKVTSQLDQTELVNENLLKSYKNKILNLEAKINELEQLVGKMEIDLEREKKSKNQLTNKKINIKEIEYPVYRGPKGGLFYVKDGIKKYVTNYFQGLNF